MKVLVILGHPRIESLCGALADAYCAGASEGGAEVRRIDLAALAFDPYVHTVSPNEQAFEDALLLAREAIQWADHLVLVYPTWWGAAPALLKGFVDRVFTPAFAFETCEGGTGYRGLLGGRSAQLITTMDTPPLVHRFVYRQPGRNGLARATLGFCGIEPVRALACGPVRTSTTGQRLRWIARARQLGRSANRGLSPGERLGRKARAWFQALRLQFYPMTWAAYAVGAMAAGPAGGVLGTAVFWWGYLCLFLLEAATVFINDLVDYPSDSRNRHFSTFSGGSRVLVEGVLSRGELRVGAALALAAAVAALAGLLAVSPASPAPILLVFATMAVLALGYTAPPLKLCYRGLGELDVAVTHSVGVIVCGYVFLGGAWNAPLPWLLGLPLLVAILPSITLSGVPDLEADAAAGKGTIAVRLGVRGALLFALAATVVAAALALGWQMLDVGGGAFDGIAYLVLPNAAWLSWLLVKRLRADSGAGRIDGLMLASLTYVLWFGLVPLFGLPP